MIFSGYSFTSYDAFSNTPAYVQPVKRVSVLNAVFDIMHTVDLSASNEYDEMPPGWDIDTIMRAEFRGDAAAGNVDISIYRSTAMRVKRRRVGDSRWVTIREIATAQPSDFAFTVYDVLCKADTTYEFAIVPLIDAIEGPIVSMPVESKFDGIYIADSDQSYHALMNPTLNHERARGEAIVETLGSKYPFSIKHGAANYSKGSLTAFFLPVKQEGCGFTTVGAIPFRVELDDFLTNNKSKIIKDDKGRMWLVDVVGGVQETNGGHPDYKLTAFNWIEIGDHEDQSDLYHAGLVNTSGG